MTILHVCGVPPSAAFRRRVPLGLRLRFGLVPLLLFNPVGCSSGLGCNDPSVRQALDQALDNLYAESRKLAKVGVTVNDIVTVSQNGKQASCKALVHIAVDFLGIQKEDRDSSIEYVAEIAESGRTFVTITTPQ